LGDHILFHKRFIRQLGDSSEDGRATIVVPSDPGFDDDGLQKLFQNITAADYTDYSAVNTSNKLSTKTIILLSTLIPILALIAGSILVIWLWRRTKHIDHAITELPDTKDKMAELPLENAGVVAELPSPNPEKVIPVPQPPITEFQDDPSISPISSGHDRGHRTYMS